MGDFNHTIIFVSWLVIQSTLKIHFSYVFLLVILLKEIPEARCVLYFLLLPLGPDLRMLRH